LRRGRCALGRASGSGIWEGITRENPDHRRDPQDTYRSAFHGDAEETGTRVPRIVVDMNRARPIHLAGKQVLATDAVATAVMGFDPRGNYPSTPFLHGDNHLNQAADLKLGTNQLDEIAVIRASIADVRRQFKPAI
jgi:hypothetical protein